MDFDFSFGPYAVDADRGGRENWPLSSLSSSRPPRWPAVMGTVVDTILGSGINYVGLAVPFFFLLIGIEIVAGLIERKRLYRFNDSITDLSCGIVDQIVAIFFERVALCQLLVSVRRTFVCSKWPMPHPR